MFHVKTLMNMFQNTTQQTGIYTYIYSLYMDMFVSLK